tara:strand:- start:58 stop:705 length:648 start_codon:yes stop_codon:yes gene_type:complete
MYKKKYFFIVFEGIEGSGKSYQSKRLFLQLKRKGFSVLLTREPGGTKSAEEIRKVILKDYFYKKKKEEFNAYTDTLLYLAARNEHLQKKIIPALKKRKIVICDRFIDSTIAYQVYGKKVKRSFVNSIHKHILSGIKPNIVFLLKVDIKKSIKRINLRGKKNRYDKFSKNFYSKAQNAFIKIAKNNKSKYKILNSSLDTVDLENLILKIVLKKLDK